MATETRKTSIVTMTPAFGKGADYDSLIKLFEAKGINARELAALMGAHTVSRGTRYLSLAKRSPMGRPLLRLHPGRNGSQHEPRAAPTRDTIYHIEHRVTSFLMPVDMMLESGAAKRICQESTRRLLGSGRLP